MGKLQVTNHDFIIYKDENSNVNVLLINQDLWLTQNLIAELFGVARSTITEHINNIFKEGELDENNTVGKTDIDNSKKTVKIYNCLEKTTQKITQKINKVKLNKNQLKIVDLMRNNPNITINEISKILNTTVDGVKYNLRKLT